MDFNLALVEKEAKSEVYCASGIVLNEKYVLITANLFWNEFFKEKNHAFDDDFFVINESPKYKDNIIVKWKNNDSLIAKKANVFAFILNNDLYTTKNIFTNWKIDFEENSNATNLPLSLFFVLTVSDKKGDVNEFKAMLKCWWDKICGQRIDKGQDILCSSVSFGNMHFFGSHSQGIVSNIVGNNGCLILSDMPSTPGSEGSPVFCSKNKTPFGIIISSVNWWKNEFTGCTLIADLRPVLLRLLNFKPNTMIEKSIHHKALEASDFSIVKVIFGCSWGSGIILDKNNGLILTNSHIFDEDDNGILKINWRNNYSKGILIYKTAENSTFDIALVSCPDIKHWKAESIQINEQTISLGDTIYATGFSLFSSESSVSPTISKGHISQVSNGIIKTTSSIHAGASGGAILTSDGKLVGIIVCNIKILDSSVFPRVNMAIPILKILPTINKYLSSKDLEMLRELETNNNEIIKHWRMLKGKL